MSSFDLSSFISADLLLCDAELLGKLSPYPTGSGQYVYAKTGVKKEKRDAIRLQPIFPLEQVGSGKKDVRTAKKTAKKSHNWMDEVGTPVAYPAAARADVPAEKILAHYRKNRKKHGLPNTLYDHKGGALETVSIAAAMLNEMLLRVENGVLTVFPNWDDAIDASFTDLRADGAFLVSAEMTGGVIRSVSIKSEKGTPLTIRNPYTNPFYGGCRVSVGDESADCDGELIEIRLEAGQTALVLPRAEEIVGLSRKAVKSAKKAEKAGKKEEKEALRQEKKALKKEAKQAKFLSKVEASQAKANARKAAKADRKENKKYAKFDKKTAKEQAKRAKKAAKKTKKK